MQPQPYVDQVSFYVNKLQERQDKYRNNKRRTRHAEEIDEILHRLLMVLKEANNYACRQHVDDLCKRVYDDKYNQTTTRFLLSIGLEY
jgi:conjugal transfer/entry exclusion protein